MAILSFEKPATLRPTAEHNDVYQADCAVPGTYVPNMSEADRQRWKAKKIGGDDPRVEVRKTIGGTQMLLVARPDGSVVLSANSKLEFDTKTLGEFFEAISEAIMAA